MVVEMLSRKKRFFRALVGQKPRHENFLRFALPHYIKFIFLNRKKSKKNIFEMPIAEIDNKIFFLRPTTIIGKFRHLCIFHVIWPHLLPAWNESRPLSSLCKWMESGEREERSKRRKRKVEWEMALASSKSRFQSSKSSPPPRKKNFPAPPHRVDVAGLLSRRKTEGNFRFTHFQNFFPKWRGRGKALWQTFEFVQVVFNLSSSSSLVIFGPLSLISAVKL